MEATIGIQLCTLGILSTAFMRCTLKCYLKKSIVGVPTSPGNLAYCLV